MKKKKTMVKVNFTNKKFLKCFWIAENLSVFHLLEEEDDREDWRQRKKIYHFTKFKQDKLMVKYVQDIEKLKMVRKKNLYLQVIYFYV